MNNATVSQMLQMILNNPNSPAMAKMQSYISTENGQKDFINTLKLNEPLSYIYLKMSVKSWIEQNINHAYYSHEFILFIISVVNQPNRHFVYEYMEQLSNYNKVSSELVSQLVSQKNLDMLEAVFMKYTTSMRSNELYTEIANNIERTIPLLNEIYFNVAVVSEVENIYLEKLRMITEGVNLQEDHTFTSTTSNRTSNMNSVSPSNASRSTLGQIFYNEHLLNVLYSLMYQDIHSYFEDNAEYFFKCFLVLFDDSSCQETVIKIFELFVTKYPEFTNFEMIILALTRIESMDSTIINTLTRAYEYKRIHTNLIINMLQKILPVSYKEEDVYSFTRDMLKGIDIYRGSLYKLIKLVNPSPYYFSKECAIFVSSITKYKDDNLVDMCSNILDSPIEDFTLSFSSFMYFISISYYKTISLGYLSTDLKFLCLKYISLSLKSEDLYHTTKLIERVQPISSHGGSISSIGNDMSAGKDPFIPRTGGYEFSFTRNVNLSRPITSSYNKVELLSGVISLLALQINEFCTDLLLRVVKSDESLLSEQLYDYISGLFTKIDKMATLPATHLFDLYIGLSVKLKKYNLNLIESILNNEIVDLYCLAFHYLAVLVQEVNIPSSFVLNVLGQDLLWAERSLHMSLTLITVSAYKKGMIQSRHVYGVYDKLDNLCRSVLLSKCHFHCRLQEINKETIGGGEELKFLMDEKVDLNWLQECFFEKKLARMVINKLVDSGLDREIVDNAILRNMGNMEFEFTLHFVTCFFGL